MTFQKQLQEEDTENESAKVTVDSFTLICLLGTGAYAKVCLVEKNDTNQKFAMKIISKKAVKNAVQQEHVFNELKVLQKCEHPFIIRLFYSFQNKKKLYFIIEHCPGRKKSG